MLFARDAAVECREGKSRRAGTHELTYQRTSAVGGGEPAR